MSTAAILIGNMSWIASASDITLKVALLLVAASLAAAICWRKSAAVRHHIWCLTFCGALLIPLLLRVTPQWDLSVLPPNAAASVSAAGLIAARHNGVDLPIGGELDSELALDADALFEFKQSLESSSKDSFLVKQRLEERNVSSSPTNASPAPTTGRWSLGIQLGVTWCFGFMVSIIPLLAGAIQKRLMRIAARERTDGASNALLAELSTKIGLTRSVSMFESKQEADVVPMTWGVLSPVIMLPSSCRHWSRKRWRVVLLHELAHIQRLDLPYQLLARLVCAIFWFNPLVWYGWCRLRAECERACDDRVVSTGERASDYAMELVGIAEMHRAPPIAVALAMARARGLEERIHSMFDSAKSHVPLTRISALGLFVTASLLVLLTVAVRPVARGVIAAQAEPRSDSLSNLTAATPLNDPLPEGAKLRLGTSWLRQGTSWFRHPQKVLKMVLSPDGNTAIASGLSYVIAWSTETGQERWRASTPQERRPVEPSQMVYTTHAISFTSDSKRFYKPDYAGNVEVWDVASGHRELLPIITAEKSNKDGDIPEPDAVAARKKISLKDTYGSIIAFDATSDGKMFAVGVADGVTVFDKNGQELYEMKKKPGWAPDLGTLDGEPRHIPAIYVRFSPDNNLLAVMIGDMPDVIRLFESQTGNEIQRVELNAKMVRLSFSPDGKQIVASERGDDRRGPYAHAVSLYSVDSGRQIWSDEFQAIPSMHEAYSYVSTVAHSPDGKLIAVCTGGGLFSNIYLLDTTTGNIVGTLDSHTWQPWAIAFTADSNVLYSAGADGVVRRWDVNARKRITPPNVTRAKGVIAASPDGKTLAYVDDMDSIRLVDTKDGRERRTLSQPGTICSRVIFSNDGQKLAGGGLSRDGPLFTIWDVETGKTLLRWDWPQDPNAKAIRYKSRLQDMCFSSDGMRLAIAAHSLIYVVDLLSGQEIAEPQHNQVLGMSFNPSGNKVRGLSFSPDGKTLATTGGDRFIRFWDTDTWDLRQEKAIFDGDLRMIGPFVTDSFSVCYSPNGGLLATIHNGWEIRIWRADDMKQLASFKVKSTSAYDTMSFSPDGSLMAFGGRENISIWDPRTGKQVWEQAAHQGKVHTVGFGHDGRTLVSGGHDDGVCYLWSLPSLKP